MPEPEPSKVLIVAMTAMVTCPTCGEATEFDEQALEEDCAGSFSVIASERFFHCHGCDEFLEAAGCIQSVE